MANLRGFINKLKEENYKRKERDAQKKGFSSYEVYEMQTGIERKLAGEKAKSTLRKKELKRIREEEYQDVIEGRSAKAMRIQRKVRTGLGYVQKGTKVYNDIIGGIHDATGSRGSSLDYGDSTIGYPKQRKQESLSEMFGMSEPSPRRKKSSSTKYVVYKGKVYPRGKTKSKRKRKSSTPKNILDYGMRY